MITAQEVFDVFLNLTIQKLEAEKRVAELEFHLKHVNEALQKYVDKEAERNKQ